MSILFADIYDGIRAIRITKGVSEKDILNYVQEKVGGCMKVGNVLKTIKTLKRLCEEGVLLQNGKRYSFAPKFDRPKPEEAPPEEEEEEEEEEEKNGKGDKPLDMDDDECEQAGCEGDDDEGDGDDAEGEEQEGGEGEEEDEEEEDDDEDEEEDDDDDDDDEGCGDKEEAPGEDENCETEEKKPETKCNIPENFPPPNGGVPNGTAASKNVSDPSQCDRKLTRALVNNKTGRSETKDQTMVEQESEGKNRGNEAIAFCVRDFMDALGRRSSGEKQEQSGKSEDLLQENMDGAQTLDMGKGKKRVMRAKRKLPRQTGFRSRSPRKDGQSELYHCLGQGRSDDNGFRRINSGIFQEPGDVEMDVDVEKGDVSFEPEGHHRIDMGLPAGNHLGDIEPLCVDDEKKTFEAVKMEQSFEDLAGRVDKKASQSFQVPNTNCPLTHMTWYPLEDREKDPDEPLKRHMSSEDERNKEKTESLCSVCEKKKRNS